MVTGKPGFTPCACPICQKSTGIIGAILGFYRDHRALILGLCRDNGKEHGKYHAGVIWGILSRVDVEVLLNWN